LPVIIVIINIITIHVAIVPPGPIHRALHNVTLIIVHLRYDAFTILIVLLLLQLGGVHDCDAGQYGLTGGVLFGLFVFTTHFEDHFHVVGRTAAAYPPV
jgi:hypothetical protein